MKTWIMAAALGAVASGAAQAQTTFVWPSPPSSAVGPVHKYYLPAGTPLILRTRVQVNTREAKLGDRVFMEVAQPVVYRGFTVIPVGAPVMGEIVQMQRNGHFGRKGKISVRVIEAQTPSGPIRLSGTAYDEGRSGTAVSIGTIMFVSVLGFLVHGTSGDIPADSTVQAYLAEPLTFRWQNPGDYRDVTSGALPAQADPQAGVVG